MRAPSVKAVPGGFVVSPGFVPRRGFLLWIAEAIGIFQGHTPEPPKRATAFGMPRIRPTDERAMENI